MWLVIQGIAGFLISRKTAANEFCDIEILAAYRYQNLWLRFSQADDIEEELLRLKIPVVAEYNAKPINLLPVFSF